MFATKGQAKTKCFNILYPSIQDLVFPIREAAVRAEGPSPKPPPTKLSVFRRQKWIQVFRMFDLQAFYQSADEY